MRIPTPPLAMTVLVLLAVSPLGAPAPARAQSQERPYWENSAPRAGTRVDREPLDELPPPRASAPGYGTSAPGYGTASPGYGTASPNYGAQDPRDRAGNDYYRPPRPLERDASSYREPPPSPAYRDNLPAPGYGERYSPPPRDLAYGNPGTRQYDDADDERPRDGTFSMREINRAGHGFFGSVSQGLGSVIEFAFKSQGRPNGYILGEDLGGAFVAGLRYGEGTLHTRDAGRHKVYWQGPSIGYDAGAEGSKVMVLVYNLRDPSEIYERFGGIAGSAYVVGGVGVTFQKHNHVVLAPIRSGIGLRLGANIGYLKYTRRPTWNPF